MSNQTNFSWVIPLNDLSSICVMGCLILPQDHLIWHCQNTFLVGTGDRAPPKIATSLPALTSPLAQWGRALWSWCEPWATSDLKSLKICVHHISQEEVASAELLGQPPTLIIAPCQLHCPVSFWFSILFSIIASFLPGISEEHAGWGKCSLRAPPAIKMVLAHLNTTETYGKDRTMSPSTQIWHPADTTPMDLQGSELGSSFINTTSYSCCSLHKHASTPG